MKLFHLVTVVLLVFTLSACGGGNSASAIAPAPVPICTASAATPVTISGTITYDFVPNDPATGGLNYAATVAKPARGVDVQAIDGNNSAVCMSSTNASGLYQLQVPANTTVAVRALAKMSKTGAPSWTFRVIDNTSGGAQWSMQGPASSSGATAQTRNLHAASGWGGAGYTGNRTAAPFAILDDVYDGVTLMLSVAPNTQFTPLNLNWSPQNSKLTPFNLATGSIGTTFFNGSGIYILGDADVDTDEFDKHVIIHEFGHYIESNFSRSDSIGGSHAGGEHLDLRLAFGEGFGNAFSAMASNDPVYSDSKGVNQALGSPFDVSVASWTNPGWFSEGSIHHILYQTYTSPSLGFKSIFDVLSAKEKNTPALTSIFSFITALKANNPGQIPAIDTLVNAQGIDSNNMDAYGTNETHNGGLTVGALLIYTIIAPGGTVSSLCTTATYGQNNKLGNNRFLRLQVAAAGTRTVTVTGDSFSYPLIDIYSIGSDVAHNYNTGTTKSINYNFAQGDYIIEITDASLTLPDFAERYGLVTRTGQSCLTVNVTN